MKKQYNAIICHFVCVWLAAWVMNRNVKQGFTETYRVLFTFYKGVFCGAWQGVQLFRLWPQFILALLGGMYTVGVPFFRMNPCFLLRSGGIRVCSPRAIFVGAEMILFAREAAGLFFRRYNMTRRHMVCISARVVHLRSAGRSCANQRHNPAPRTIRPTVSGPAGPHDDVHKRSVTNSPAQNTRLSHSISLT